MKTLLTTFILLIGLLISCNNVDYKEAYNNGYRNAMKTQKTFYEFKNVPYNRDSIILFRKDNLYNVCDVLVKHHGDSIDIKVKIWVK